MNSSVVLIHGTNAGPWTVENFFRYFEQEGFHCHSPSYRFHEDSSHRASERRLIGISIADYVDDILGCVKTLDTLPILVGHSLGGVIAQQLAAMGLARGLVLLNGSVNWGICPTTHHERSLGKKLMEAGAFWNSVLLPDFETMATYGLNKLSLTDQHRIFNRLGPESGRVMFELFFWFFDEYKTTKIDYDRITCPVLMISGSDDLAIPPSTARLIAERHGSKVSFHEVHNFGHYLTLEPEWKTIAARCARWMKELN